MLITVKIKLGEHGRIFLCAMGTVGEQISLKHEHSSLIKHYINTKTH